ncbi:MAG: hypothetical protein B9S32_16895 [Verrucomicrobia bacterium Tous-C9LFEB]|nr:MAG: hypothetical protein B9S32_16895 [Verrucomicrobia bacterium Tous-C9LFEB]
MHEQKIIRRYQLEMTGAFILYALVLVLSLNVSKHLPDGIGRTLLMVSPMVPFLFVVWAIVRQIRRADEYCRLQSLEAIAIAAAITAGLTFTYGFLEIAGFPRLSMFTVWPVMGGVWCVIAVVRRWTER